jgi:Cu-processing system permease protein
MNPIFIIAGNTFRQTVRQKLFLNIGIFGLGMVILAVVVGNVTYGYTDRVVRSIGLSGVSIALDLMALLVGISLIYDEIDRKTLFVVLTRPIDRWQYVVGRYLGLIASLTVAGAGFVLVFITALLLAAGQPSSADLLALLGALAESMLIGAVGLLLSSFTTPMLGAGIGLGIWVAAATSDDLVRLSRNAPEFAKTIAKVAYYALPGLARFNFREAAVYGDPIGLGDVWPVFAYGALYSLCMLALTTVILERREML